jgi:chorismate mutase
MGEKAHDETNRQGDLALSVWKRIRDHLASERHRIYEEIQNYPTPIPACDAQFNYLLEERARIAQELDRLEALSQKSASRGDRVKCIDEFIVSSNYINGEVQEKIRSLLVERESDGAEAHSR